MTRFRDLFRIIKSRISDWILLAYVIWFIKMDEYRDKLGAWTYKQDEKIRDRE